MRCAIGCAGRNAPGRLAHTEQMRASVQPLQPLQGCPVADGTVSFVGTVTGVVYNAYDRVERSREELERQALKLEALIQAADENSEIWCVCPHLLTYLNAC